jgi:hypothetical protein
MANENSVESRHVLDRMWNMIGLLEGMNDAVLNDERGRFVELHALLRRSMEELDAEPGTAIMYGGAVSNG